MIRLSSKIIKAGTIGLAAMMMFTSVVFADEAHHRPCLAEERLDCDLERLDARLGIVRQDNDAENLRQRKNARGRAAAVRSQAESAFYLAEELHI